MQPPPHTTTRHAKYGVMQTLAAPLPQTLAAINHAPCCCAHLATQPHHIRRPTVCILTAPLGDADASAAPPGGAALSGAEAARAASTTPSLLEAKGPGMVAAALSSLVAESVATWEQDFDVVAGAGGYAPVALIGVPVEASSPAPEWAAAGVHVGSVSVHDTYSAAMPLVADFGYMTDDEWAAFQISVGLHKLNVVS